MPLSEGFAGPADDLALIRALNERYADAVFRRDATDWGALWAEDARWSLMGSVIDGRDAIVALWQDRMATLAFVGFFVQPGALAVSGDSADGRVWTRELLVMPDGARLDVVGRYDDRYVRTAGEWLFAERTYTRLNG
jgi:uncharacterized protein (TIGR02246 family)